MNNICQLYLDNNKALPFKVQRNTWGYMSITVDKVDNFTKSGRSYYCDAYTLSENYDSERYGTKEIDGVLYKKIGCAGNYSWHFAEDTGI